MFNFTYLQLDTKSFRSKVARDGLGFVVKVTLVHFVRLMAFANLGKIRPICSRQINRFRPFFRKQFSASFLLCDTRTFRP